MEVTMCAKYRCIDTIHKFLAETCCPGKVVYYQYICQPKCITHNFETDSKLQQILAVIITLLSFSFNSTHYIVHT